MALATRAIRSKIKSVGNIKKITKAMEMVAASKMRKAVNRALAGREYATRLVQLVSAISQEQDIELPFFAANKSQRTLVMVIQANKGLCGGFNIANSKVASATCRELGLESVDFITIGRSAERFARPLGTVKASFVTLPEDVHAEDIYPLSQLVFREFRSGNYGKVFCVYNSFISALSYKPIVKQLLPLVPQASMSKLEENESYVFEPDIVTVLAATVPRLVEAEIYQALLESYASEHSARMLAMKNATDSAQSLIDDLALTYNNARQAGITQEIAEIAAGADSLSAA